MHLLSIARLDLSVDRRLTNGGQFFIESIWALNEFKNFIKTSFDFSSIDFRRRRVFCRPGQGKTQVGPLSWR